MQEIPVKPLLHVFVCVNDRSKREDTTMPSCAPTITKQEVKEAKQWIREQGLVNQVFCTATQCLGFCSKDGANACAWPTGRYVRGLQNAKEIITFIEQELAKVKT